MTDTTSPRKSLHDPSACGLCRAGMTPQFYSETHTIYEHEEASSPTLAWRALRCFARGAGIGLGIILLAFVLGSLCSRSVGATPVTDLFGAPTEPYENPRILCEPDVDGLWTTHAWYWENDETLQNPGEWRLDWAFFERYGLMAFACLRQNASGEWEQSDFLVVYVPELDEALAFILGLGAVCMLAHVGRAR